MFNIYSQDWPEVERALVAFSKEIYMTPTLLWFTPGGFIHQDIVDGCWNHHSLYSPSSHPVEGLWVWEGKFQVLEDIFDHLEGLGQWRKPTDDEWIEIINQNNPWRYNDR